MKTSLRIMSAVVLVFLWAGTASAVDKAKKDEKPKEQKVVQTPNPHTPVAPDSQGSQTNSGQSRSKDKYNDFIDTNNNGIDDRIEKVQTVKKPEEEKTKPPQ